MRKWGLKIIFFRASCFGYYSKECLSATPSFSLLGHHLRKNQSLQAYNAWKHLMNINSNSNQWRAKRIAQLGEIQSCFFMGYLSKTLILNSVCVRKLKKYLVKRQTWMQILRASNNSFLLDRISSHYRFCKI